MRTPPPARAARRHVAAHPMRRSREVHILGCDCPTCEPYLPAAPPALSNRQILALGTVGLAVGHAIAFAIDPAGTAEIAVDLLRWWFL